jgi:hypothetical protein
MYFPQYVPKIDPIGVDLRQFLDYAHSWVVSGTPYIANNANTSPPLVALLFRPLLLLDFHVAYVMITIVTLLCFTLATLLIVFLVRGKRLTPLIVLFFITGLFSYGLQFELERGSFSVITFFLCLLSIYIFHYHHRYRFLAYLLLSLAVQLKLFPAIFLVMFIRDWADWKGNVKRISAILAINLALFLVLGPKVFVDFLGAVKGMAVNPFVWVGNHSIRSFTSLVLGHANGIGAVLLQLCLLGLVVICLGCLMLKAYREKTTGLNQSLLLACTIGGMVVPSVSHDTRLPILAASVAIFLPERLPNTNAAKRLFSIALIVVISIAYSSTLFSYTNKPLLYFRGHHLGLLLENNLPALMVMLVACTVFSIATGSRYRSSMSYAE